jgi:predicted porin
VPARRGAACILFVLVVASFPNLASAEKVLVSKDGWDVFTDGRAGGFISHAYGDGYPQPTYGYLQDAAGNDVIDPVTGQRIFVPGDYVHIPQEGGGFRSVSEQEPVVPGTQAFTAGTINMTRFRSGFVGNTFGFGARGKLTPWTTLTAYVQLWTFVENDGRQKNIPNVVDARQGYARLEGPWGSFTAGRVRGLFSRANTDIDAMYGHRWGVGWPGAIDNKGPTLGQLSFGVLGAGFSSGFVFVTPSIAGLQLHVGVFDPVQLQGYGSWTRTKYARPEAELTFERTFAGGWGKIFLFGNGVQQRVYKEGYCTPSVDPVTLVSTPCATSSTVAGVGYGGRIELGRFRLGASGYYGQGLGMKYALEVSEAAQDRAGTPRKSSGVHVQTMVVLGKVDVFAGAGIAQIYLTDYDNNSPAEKKADPRDIRLMDPDPAVQAMARQVFKYTIIKDQIGVNAGIVYHVTPNLHANLDFFRAQADWFAVNGFAGQKQVVWVGNTGMTVNW